jgi:hypothetical protein
MANSCHHRNRSHHVHVDVWGTIFEINRIHPDSGWKRVYLHYSYGRSDEQICVWRQFELRRGTPT